MPYGGDGVGMRTGMMMRVTGDLIGLETGIGVRVERGTGLERDRVMGGVTIIIMI